MTQVTKDFMEGWAVRRSIQTHEAVGQEVRNAIKKIGGTLPEKIPPAEHIKSVAKRVKTTTPKLKLEDEVAVDLLGARS